MLLPVDSPLLVLLEMSFEDTGSTAKGDDLWCLRFLARFRSDISDWLLFEMLLPVDSLLLVLLEMSFEDPQ
jgi:hypothetical protein